MKSVTKYQEAKNIVSDAIVEVKAKAERMEETDEFRQSFYELLEAVAYLERVFNDFAAENIPGC